MLLLIAHSSAPARRPLSFCDLVRNASEYNGQEVTVRASHEYWFEWSDLYCLDCIDKGRVWLELPIDLDEASQKALERAPEEAGVVNVTVRGVFHSGGHYGHQNMWRHEIVASQIRDVAVVVKGMVVSDKQKAAEKRWACGGSEPR